MVVLPELLPVLFKSKLHTLHVTTLRDPGDTPAQNWEADLPGRCRASHSLCVTSPCKVQVLTSRCEVQVQQRMDQEARKMKTRT